MTTTPTPSAETPSGPLDGVSVLSSCRDAARVAEALGLPASQGQPTLGARYVIVVPDAASLELVTGADERGFTVVASVAWRLPAALVARLANLPVPMLVGLPNRSALEAAISRGNTNEMRQTIGRWTVAESYFARPAASSPRAFELSSTYAMPAASTNGHKES